MTEEQDHSQAPADSSATPTGFGKTLAAVFGNFGRYFKPMLPVSLAVGVIVELGQYMTLQDAMRIEQGQEPQGGLFLGMLLILVATSYFNIVGYRRADSIQRTGGTGNEFTEAWSRFLPMLAFMILYAVAVAIGGLLLLIPGLILAILFVVGDVQVALGKAGPLEAFRQSASLVWGNWWYSFGLVLVVGLVVAIPVSIIEMIIEPMRLAEGGEVFFAALISVVVMLVVFPIFISLFYTLLRSLKARKAIS